MTEIITTVTQRGQVTIPSELRRFLGVKPHDKVVFSIANGHVRLASAVLTLEDAYGSVAPHSQPEDFVELARAAREEHVAKVARKLGSR